MNLWVETLLTKKIIESIRDKADRAVNQVFVMSSLEVQDFAKKHAPWKDRTGRARRTLKGSYECIPYSKKTLVVAGHMTYSMKLEFRWGGKYSILYPTIVAYTKPVLDAVVDAVGGVTVETV